jgi:hypothetical protein
MLFPMLNVLYFTPVLSAVRVQCPVWLFYVVTWCRAFPVCRSGIIIIIIIIIIIVIIRLPYVRLQKPVLHKQAQDMRNCADLVSDFVGSDR